LPEKVFRSLKLLEVLHLEENNLQNLSGETFAGLISLRRLYLQKNRLKFIQSDLFKNLKSLQNLGIRKNPLKIIDNMVFHDLANLRKLDMSGIPFSTLPEGLFKNNINLESVDLRSAKITRISNKQFSHIKTLRVIDFEDSFCASTKFLRHNSSVLFTEDMLLPCSCTTSDKIRRESNFSIYFVLGMALIVIIVVFTCKFSARFTQSYRYRRLRKGMLLFVVEGSVVNANLGDLRLVDPPKYSPKVSYYFILTSI
jgi:hypothetical protein